MKYMLMLWGDEAVWDQLSEAEQHAELDKLLAFSRLLDERGIAYSGEGLQPSAAAIWEMPP